MNFLLVIATLSSLVVALTGSPVLWDQTSSEIDLREGDMAVQKNSKSFGLTSRANNWPNGVVPYEIDTKAGYLIAEISTIKQAMEMLSSKTGRCITFVPRTAADKTWIKIFSGSGCWSYVGKTYTGAQELSLRQGTCTYKGTIVHELMHAIGFHHEQNRPDRDEHIRVNLDNVAKSQVHNFDKKTGQTFSTPYDLKSIMQYDEYAFSMNGRKTIIPLNGETLIPSYRKTDAQILTANDISAIRQLYQCSNPIVTTMKPATFPVQTLGPIGSSFRLVLTNDLSESVDLILVDVYDTEKKICTIAPRAKRIQGTIVGAKWIIRRTEEDISLIVGDGQIIASNVNVLLSALVFASTQKPTTVILNTLSTVPVTRTEGPTTTLTLHSPYKFNIKNDLEEEVQLYWISNNDGEILYNTLEHLGTVVQTSYVGHNWVLRGSNFYKKFTCGRGKFVLSDIYITVSEILN